MLRVLVRSAASPQCFMVMTIKKALTRWWEARLAIHEGTAQAVRLSVHIDGRDIPADRTVYQSLLDCPQVCQIPP